MTSAAALARPTIRLPLAQLLQLSVYWFGINATWGAFEIFQQERITELVDPAEAGRWLALMETLAAVVAIAVQPTIGTISDYTISRWGRRKPYIAIGAALDVVAMVGLVTAQSYLWFLAFLLLLQFSSNFAQGPFQGYVPDLVPEEQVGLASSLMGLMIFAGLICGTLVVSMGYSLGGNLALPMIAIALVEFATAIGTVLFVREGHAARPREGRSWPQVARSTWGLDILRQRSYVWLLASRLCVLSAGAFFGNLNVLYMERSLGFGDPDKAFWIPVGLIVIVVSTVGSTVVAGPLSDRVGRKAMITLACALGAVGMSIVALAPSIEVAMAGLVLFGLANGSFISADWALMTDIIPKESAGRYMGMSNVATALQAPVAVIVGGLLMDHVGGPALGGDGPRAAFLAAVAFYGLGAVLLRPVQEPVRRRRGPRDEHGAGDGLGPATASRGS